MALTIARVICDVAFPFSLAEEPAMTPNPLADIHLHKLICTLPCRRSMGVSFRRVASMRRFVEL